MNIFKRIEKRSLDSSNYVEYKIVPKRLVFSLESLFEKVTNWRR
jgi:hypothetical protein